MSQQTFNINLNISFSDSGNRTREVIEMYGVRIRDDIDQTAWNLCDCNDAIQNEKFHSLKLERWTVVHQRGGNLGVKARLNVDAQSVEFVNLVIEKYMDGFDDYISETVYGHYTRTGQRIGFNPQPSDWNVEIT